MPPARQSFLIRYLRRLKVHQKLRLCGLLGVAAALIPGLWLLATMEPVEEATPEKAQQFGHIAWALSVQALGLTFALFLGRIILNDVTRALHRLEDSSKAITAGKTEVSVLIEDRSDEIGHLAKAMKQMVEVSSADRRKLIEGNVALLVANDRLAQANMELESASIRVRQLATEAGAANVAKRNFLAVMSHEIRTPVNGIIGMTELTLKTGLTADQRDFLETVNCSAQGLLELLNDILDFSKIEAGKLELERTDFRLRDVLDDTLATYAARAHSKGLELLLDVRPNVPDMLVGDPYRLRQIILNLVSNSLRFTTTGDVVVQVSMASEMHLGGTEAALHFSVRDTGCGIPVDKCNTIFEAFSQADGSTTRQYGGTGLGLAIARELVTLMGGAIAVRSELGQGSEFTFRARFGARIGGATDIPVALLGRRALVIEPHLLAAALLEEKLGAMGVECVCRGDAAAGVAALERGGNFDFVLTDTLKPTSGGAEFYDAVADSRRRGNRAALILLVAATSHEGRAFPESAGHVLKPVSGRRLRAALCAAVQPKAEQQSPHIRSISNAPHGRRLRILVAEDNATNRRIVNSHLKNWGHEVRLSEDGEEAVDCFIRESFDLVLMDLQMPKLDGTAAARRIRQLEKDKRLRRTPIIALTANVLKGVREECNAAGMDGYLGKPMREHELLDCIEEIVPGLRRSDAQAITVALPTPEANSGLPFDVAALLSSIGGSKETLAGLLADCRDEDVPELIQTMDDALAAGDTRSLGRAAHALKGVVGVFHAAAAHEAALRLEQRAKSGETEGFEKDVEELRRAVSEMLHGLETFLAGPSTMAA